MDVIIANTNCEKFTNDLKSSQPFAQLLAIVSVKWVVAVEYRVVGVQSPIQEL